MTTRDIEETIKDIYGVEVSESSISNYYQCDNRGHKRVAAKASGCGLFGCLDGWYCNKGQTKRESNR